MDEAELINFLLDRQAEAGDSATFKPAVWNAAALHLEQFQTKGGPKTVNSCSTKWTWLKENYNTISILKNWTSDLSWSDKDGLNVTVEKEENFKILLTTNPKASQFKNKGFPHYDAMHDIMSKRVKGKHTFCTLVQSHDAAASNPSLSNGKEKEIDIDINGSDDKLVAITEPSASTTNPIPIPSTTSASSSKHKHSALGEDDSAVSGSRTSCSSGK
ncbi:hypothetical protein PILCRDRAFT_14909 [Piloderma croceum F 1598]|uniref:Myb/SANT-like domain-containing protein n=1 Tax=Piloderma croceum (strain F 1598) TaxID=765440 RepID=A0A0C3F0Z6_PILCF|nr:hypothetical protein PILCRDRAFT_14909 [Piloderma croceum F 1598]